MTKYNAKKTTVDGITFDFEVLVTRFYDGEYPSWEGMFISKVYAIRGNEFLVYDGGDMIDNPQGFEWVDFTKMIPQCGAREDAPYVPMVELYERKE